jgi:hypothetical protein
MISNLGSEFKQIEEKIERGLFKEALNLLKNEKNIGALSPEKKIFHSIQESNIYSNLYEYDKALYCLCLSH